jgi:methylated-DNA-[protein]-cysteine S-methyltransferase
MKDETINTPFGAMTVQFEGDKIKRLNFLWKSNFNEESKNKKAVAFKREICEYFKGKRKSFSFKVGKIEGTDFQMKVFKEVAKIPFGKTLTYKEVAKQLGNANLARAVGGALRNNPVAILIPCHRVVAKDGIGGYAGIGHSKIKRQLLQIEGKDVKVNNGGR